ncbi:EKC/KEOPS complex subunit BUD32 [Naviculisporaceae sp. PSN 640]
MAVPAPAPEGPGQFPLPKILTYPSSTPPTLITQGAEGRVYKTTHLDPSRPCILKYRPPKPYRHPILDARLTKERITAEAHVLARCAREGVPVPAVYATDPKAGWMMIEFIEGVPVRQAINEFLGKRPETDEEKVAAEEIDYTPLIGLLEKVGRTVGGLHATGNIHGDLTTSNMMLRPLRDSMAETAEDGSKAKAVEGDVVLIDFGLATQSASEEDRAVDLYVLERAFASTHPRAEKLFQHVLDAYGKSFKKAGATLHKLEDVRRRGRKKSMLG